MALLMLTLAAKDCRERTNFLCRVKPLELPCSFFGGGTSGTRHEVGALRDVVHSLGKHLKGSITLNAVRLRRGGHCPGVQRSHLRLKSRDALFFRYIHGLLS